MWTHDITKQSGLQSHVIQRAVKNLSDQKKLIKPLKSIHQKNRKIYILANLEPAKEVKLRSLFDSSNVALFLQVVGGTFYDNGEFDVGFVVRLRDQIIHVLKNGSQASIAEIESYIKSSGFGRVGY